MNFQAEILNEGKKLITRRHFFKNCGVGLGSVALTSLLNEKLFAAQQATNPLAPKIPHFTGKAKRVIYIFQAGGPSHLDLFDYKPALVKYNGQKPPEEMLKGIQNVFINKDAALYASEFKFAKYGQSGAEISEVIALSRQSRGRHLHRENDCDRRNQSRSCTNFYEHRVQCNSVVRVLVRG